MNSDFKITLVTSGEGDALDSAFDATGHPGGAILVDHALPVLKDRRGVWP